MNYLQSLIKISLSSCLEIGKAKVQHRRDHEGPVGEKRYSSTLSLTSAPAGDEWSTARPGSKETRYPYFRRLVGSQSWSERMIKISSATRFDLRTVQPVASRYTHYTIPVHSCYEIIIMIISCYEVIIMIIKRNKHGY